MSRSRSRKLRRRVYALTLSFVLFLQVFPCRISASPEPGLPPTLEDRIRFEQQAAFGYTDSLDASVSSLGFDAWITSQAGLGYTPPNGFPDDPIANPLRTISPRPHCDGYSIPPEVPDTPADCFRDSYTLYPLQKWFIKEALHGNDQLRNKVAWALSQIWVTSGLEIKQSRQMAEYYKILYNFALGDSFPTKSDYLELMRQMTSSPAMGEYLDMAYSKRGFANENYPRELMQLFTTGLYLLNNDGSPQCINNDIHCQSSHTPAPVYTQETIDNFAKVFTGWTFCGVTPQCSKSKLGTVNYIDPMFFNISVMDSTPPYTLENTNTHDLSAKTLLFYSGSMTTSIGSCDVHSACNSIAAIAEYADASREQALKNIFEHPSTPPFVARLLIQHLVTSNPEPDYINRVANVFINNGQGQRGDMLAVVRAILLDTKARGATPTDLTFGKLREPVQFATNILRPLKVKGANSAESDGVIFRDEDFDRMGQRPFYSPSVFNYYSPQNTIVFPNDESLFGPEFGLFTPTTVVARANFAKTIIYKGLSAGTDIPNGTKIDISDLISLAGSDPTGDLLVNELNTRLMHGSMSGKTKSAIKNAVVAMPTPGNEIAKAKAAVYLTVTSAEFQVQR